MLLKRVVSCCLLLTIFFHSLQSQSPPDDAIRRLEAVRASESFRIDGELLEKEWQMEAWTRFIQREPHEGEPASEKTEVWIAYDERALYVAARLYDSKPDSIVGRLARRDTDSESDLFVLAIDASLDRRTGFYFSVNPAGAIEDGIYYSDHQSDASWDGVWEAAVNIDKSGWTVEMRIPYSQLRFPSKEKHIWGIDFRRRIQRKNEESYFVYHPLNDKVRVSRWAELHGLDGIKPPARIEFLPYLAATGKFLQRKPVEAFNQSRSDPFIMGRDYLGKFGADAKIGLSGDITLDATLNPDFAQVELDPAVLNLTAYETRFDEKRPFFIEGSSILAFAKSGPSGTFNFDWREPIFLYSRRIGREPRGSVTHKGFQDIPDRTTILGAAKVSGKLQNSWSIAALTALTNREYGSVDSTGTRFREEIEPLTFYGVVRIQKDFNKAQQGLGIISTYLERDLREPRLTNILHDRALSLGLDGWVFLDEKKDWSVSGWLGMTQVKGSQNRILAVQRAAGHYFQRPDQSHVSIDSLATSLQGWAARARITKEKGNWRFDVALGGINPKFEVNDAGFLSRSDIINGHIYGSYIWFEPDNWFRWKSLALETHRNYNYGGYKMLEIYRLIFQWSTVRYWNGYFVAAYSGEAYDDQRSRGGPIMKDLQGAYAQFLLQSDARLPLSGTFYINGAQWPSQAWSYNTGLNVQWKASKIFNVTLGSDLTRRHSTSSQYIIDRVDPLAVETYGRLYIFSTLDQTTLSASMRANWTFTPKLSLQFYLQPYISVAKFTDFKELAKAGTYSFITYGEGGSTKTLSGNRYVIDPDGAGPRSSFSFPLERDYDINFTSARLNAVLRWEYMPGSTLFFAWTNQKEGRENKGEFDFSNDVATLLRHGPDNVFSIKLTYWLNP